VNKEEAFLKTVEQHQNLVYKIASLYTNSREDREDLRQEIFYQLWKSIDSFQHQSGITTWLYRVALNTAIRQLKISKRNIPVTPLQEEHDNADEPVDKTAEEQWQAIRKHINDLGLLDKGIVILYLENKSYEEIAAIIGISVTNVGTKLSRIKEKIRQQVSDK
jgi:RNA polymerase sigma-70 factor (ECF subfamily)